MLGSERPRINPVWLIVFFLALTALLTVAAYGITRWLLIGLGSKPNRAVVFGETQHYFGKVGAGEVIRHTFVFRNNGDEDVAIARVESSCGCIVDDTARQVVKPRESGYVTVRLMTDGVTPPVHLDKRIVAYFDKKTVRAVRLELTGEVVPDVIIEPACIKFTAAEFDRIRPQELQIRNGILTRKSFASVHLVAAEPYYEVRELGRTEDQLHAEVALLPNLRAAGTGASQSEI